MQSLISRAGALHCPHVARCKIRSSKFFFNCIFSCVKELKYSFSSCCWLAKISSPSAVKESYVFDGFILFSLIFQVIQLDCLHQWGKRSCNTYLREGSHLVSLQLGACWQILGCTNLEHDEVGNNGHFLRIWNRISCYRQKLAGAVHYAGCKHGLKLESAAGKMTC